VSASVDGQWSGATQFPLAPPDPLIDDGFGVTMSDTRGLFVLHAILLHTGKVLCFSGHVEGMMYAPLFYQFDPDNPATPLTPVDFPGRPDMFCAHYVQLPDGRILAAGGSQHDMMVGAVVRYRGSEGARTIAIFDPDQTPPAWTVSRTGGVVNELAQGRWYPTLVSLPDGRVAAFSGRRENGSGVPTPSIANAVEILSPPDWNADTLGGATKSLPIYPGLHLAPNGRIYYTHTNWGQEMTDPETASILIPDGATSVPAPGWNVYPGLRPPDPRREEGMSVLLPPAQDGKILVVGGSKALKASGIGVFEGPAPNGPAAFDHIENAADARSANILDTTPVHPAPPVWSSAGTMAHGRINAHCVLLPDATVLICGGHDNYKWLSQPATTPSLIAEIYTPGTGFRTAGNLVELRAHMEDPRMYHSVALLLPDGRVFTAGGADANQDEPELTYPASWNPQRRYGAGANPPETPSPLNSKTFEFYEPPYMHNGPRPVISDVLRNGASVRRVEYGQTFAVTTPQAASIDRVAFMRPGASTHHTDSEQRYVRLEFTRGTGELTVTAVGDAKLAPPGYYMLWIVDDQGRPCERAVFMHLVPRVGQPGGGTTCFVATACFGSPLHPCVVYLQTLRGELQRAGAVSRRFIGAVTRVYELFSPALARSLECNATARAVVRGLVVRPVVSVIRWCDRASAVAPRFRQPLLIASLSAAALAGVAILPALAVAVAAAIAARSAVRFADPSSPTEQQSAEERDA
jgi:hypothetical protein